MKKYKFLWGGVLISLLAGCASPEGEVPTQAESETSDIYDDDSMSLRRDNPYQIVNLDNGEKEAAQGERTFSINLFKECIRNHPEDNMVISPFSVYESLVYLSHGANDSEKKIYSELLGSGMESIERYNMKVLEAFPVLDNGTKFVSNNSLWHDPEVRIKESFVNALNKLGGIEVFNQSPEGEKSKEAINNWVEEKTGGLIPEFLSSPLWGTTGWIFLNSIYFSSHWNMQFDPEKETTALFYDSSGGSKAIQYLRNNEAFYYYSDENIVVVELPSWNENYRMTLYMPSIPLDCWIENVSKEDMDRYHSNCKKIFLDLRIPKFNISSTFDLYPLIKELSGGKSLKLSGMLESGVANINQILQKVVLGIDEEGIRAAATTLSMTLLMDSPIRYKDVIFDRPFVYTIEETSTGTILFMGCMIQSDMAVR